VTLSTFGVWFSGETDWQGFAPVALSHICILTRRGQESRPTLDSASPERLSFPLVNLPPPPPTAVSPASLPPVPHCWGFPSSAVMCFLLASYRCSQRSLKRRQADARTHSAAPHVPVHQRPDWMCWKDQMSTWGRLSTPIILMAPIQWAAAFHPLSRFSWATLFLSVLV